MIPLEIKQRTLYVAYSIQFTHSSLKTKYSAPINLLRLRGDIHKTDGSIRDANVVI